MKTDIGAAVFSAVIAFSVPALAYGGERDRAAAVSSGSERSANASSPAGERDRFADTARSGSERHAEGGSGSESKHFG